MKLANLTKNRIKIGDFTSKDKFNLLDLFVNNEKTLIKMYEILFPTRGIIGSTDNKTKISSNILHELSGENSIDTAVDTSVIES